MRIYKKTKSFISLVCSIAILLSVFVTPVVAVDGKTVTATTNSSVKQGSSAKCYVNIDSTESLASLEVTVHFDPTKVKINNVYNSIDCTLYDSVINTDNIQFSYILDGEGSVSQTGLFQFNYQVLGNAQVGDAYFDITIGEACDGDLKNVAVSGSRCKFTIAESITNKKCKIYSTRSLNTSIEHEFSLSYSFNTYEIASGSAVITYDPELFEVVEVANGEFLNNKLTDINTGFLGAVYISFVGTAYNSKYDFVTVKFKTLKNVNEASEITFKATELCNKELNTIACDNYITTANVLYDNTYVKDAPKISVTAQYDAIKEKVTATVLLEANSRLGAGDFVIGFNTDILTLSSYEKGFSPTFFNINDKEVAEGKLKFSIISLEDITDAQKVLTVVFDSSANCAKPRTDIDITGSMLSDSMTEPIALNFIGCDILFPTGHTYGKWVITQRPNCVDLGEMKKTCSTCGDVVTDVVEAYGHDYSSEWTVDIAPTCTEKGVKSRHCLACDDKTDILEIDADGHKYETKWTIDTQPTCTEEGSKSHHCSVCGDKADVIVIPANGHSYGNWIIDVEPTCEEEGSKYKVCSVCDDVLTEAINATGHSYSTEWTIDLAPTCTDEGSKSHHCLVCDDKADITVIPANGHSYGNWIIDVEPTCEEEGSKYKVCSVCDDVLTEAINATGHSYSTEWTIDLAPTCTEEGSKSRHCLVCDDMTDITVIAANGHSYGEWIVDVAPSCEEEGSKHKICSVCDDVLTETIDATGHSCSTEWTIDIEPTVFGTGMKYKDCITCGKVLETSVVPQLLCEKPIMVSTAISGTNLILSWESVSGADTYKLYRKNTSAWELVAEIDGAQTSYTDDSVYFDNVYTYCLTAINEAGESERSNEMSLLHHAHTMGAWIERVPVTCTQNGENYRKCAVCDYQEIEVVKATGHSYSTEWTIDLAPTCIGEGIKSHHCLACDDKTDITVVSANGHNYGEWIIESEPLCEKEGSKYKVCSVCDTISHEVVLPTGHNYSTEWTIDLAPTCTETGSKSHHCLACDDKTDVTVIEASHKYSNEWTIDYPATCTTNGTKSHHCTVCDARTDITGIGATGHYYGEWIVDREAGCTSSGSRHRICSSCADVISETIKAKGHNYSTEWTVDVPNTCTTPGSKSHHCTACDAKTDVTTIAAAHEYEEFTTVDIERTCTTGGEISRHCKNCDARTDVLKTTALGHKYENYTVIREKSCTEDGYAISTCSNCGDEQSYTIRATGHLYSNAWTIDVNATCTSDGSKSYHCIYCGDRKNVTVIPMTGHSYTWTDDYEQGVSTGVCSTCGDEKYEVINIDSILTFKLNSTSTGYIVSDCITEAVGEIFVPAEYNGLPVLEIGASAFKDCSGITSVTIPEGVTKIGNQAFVNCSSLENVSVPSSATTWGTTVFRKCTNLKNINIPTGLKTLGGATFYGCSNLTEIILPEGMTSIGASSFRDCVSLARVEIPHSVSLINTYAFMNCAGLETVVYRGDETSWTSVKISSNNTPLTSDKIEYADFTHTMSDDAVIVEPTCITEGKEIYSCVYCGKEVDEIIPATGIHKYSTDWTVDIEPTCKNEGSKSHHCINCEAKTDITPVPKAHVFSTEWTVDTAPTCTVDGSKSRHCTLCEAKTDVTAIAAAHQYSTEWTIDVEPKCAEDGSKSRHCMACEDRTDITIIEAIGHNYVLTDVLSEHPHTITHTCSRCDDAIKEDNVISPCLECDYMVKTVSNSHRLIAYMGKETEVVIPTIYEGIPVTMIGNSCFRGNDNITSVEISEGIATIDSLAFMECPSLEKVYIPDSVTSIGTQAFYGFNGIIYCNSGSYAHKFAMDNNIKYVLQNIDEQEKPIQETPYTQIDYDNSIIRTSLCASSDITEILGLSDSAVAVARASYVYGDLELYGTGTFITVFDGNEYIGDFLLIVDGDVNGDSVCDAIDAFYVAQASNGLRELDDVYELAADSNADNIIDVFDYQAVINKAVS